MATMAPATSAHLMSQCNSIMLENDMAQPESHRRQACSACGNLFIPGQTCTVRTEFQRPKRKRGKGKAVAEPSESKPVAGATVYSCNSCSRSTRFQIHKPPASSSRKGNSRTRALQLGTDSTPAPDAKGQAPGAMPASANASSKKRAKARKQGGLQALLAKSKENASRGSTQGFGLDLMDLMKQA